MAARGMNGWEKDSPRFLTDPAFSGYGVKTRTSGKGIHRMATDSPLAEAFSAMALTKDSWLEIYHKHLQSCSKCTAYGMGEASKRCQQGQMNVFQIKNAPESEDPKKAEDVV